MRGCFGFGNTPLAIEILRPNVKTVDLIKPNTFMHMYGVHTLWVRVQM